MTTIIDTITAPSRFQNDPASPCPLDTTEQANTSYTLTDKNGVAVTGNDAEMLSIDS